MFKAIAKGFDGSNHYTSDCCGAYLDDAQIEYGICNDCGEHCEIITEEYPVSPVCGG